MCVRVRVRARIPQARYLIAAIPNKLVTSTALHVHPVLRTLQKKVSGPSAGAFTHSPDSSHLSSYHPSIPFIPDREHQPTAAPFQSIILSSRHAAVNGHLNSTDFPVVLVRGCDGVVPHPRPRLRPQALICSPRQRHVFCTFDQHCRHWPNTSPVSRQRDNVPLRLRFADPDRIVCAPHELLIALEISFRNRQPGDADGQEPVLDDSSSCLSVYTTDPSRSTRIETNTKGTVT